MSKVKSFALPVISSLILLAIISAYTILVFPRILSAENSSSLVFEDSPVIVTPISKPMTIEKAVPKTAPIPIPIAAPRVLYKVVPAYPAVARDRGIEGVAVVRALIDEKGSLVKVKIKTSSGSEILDNTAISSLSKWRFSPAMQGVSTVSSWIQIPFKFRLR